MKVKTDGVMDRARWGEWLSRCLEEDEASWPDTPLVPGDWKSLDGDDAVRLLLDLTQASLSEERKPICELYLPRAVRAVPAPTYPNHLLVETLVEGSSGFGIATFLYGALGVTLLDFTSGPLWRLNDLANRPLDSGTEAVAYLRLFSNSLRGSELGGRFRIVDSADDIRWADKAQRTVRNRVAKAVTPVEITSREEGGWTVSATVLMARTLSHVVFSVASDRRIKMEDDEEVLDELPVRVERFAGPVRFP